MKNTAVNMALTEKKIKKIVLCLFLLLGANACLAANIYRYENDKGNLVWDSILPPHVAKKGYTILDEMGRIVKVVPRGLTQKEIEEQQKMLEKQRRVLLKQQEQDKQDALLIRLYTSPEDIEKLRERKILELHGMIIIADKNIQKATERIAAIETQAANIERSGRTVPEQLLEKLEKQKQEVNDLDGKIQTLRKDKIQVKEKYNEDVGRLKFLLNISSPAT